MFAMSAKLVPVWSVTIEPRLIGVPEAATPGLVPQDEVLTVPPELGLDEAAAALEVAPVAALLELELELLLLHPASTPPSAMTATAAAARDERRCSCLFMCLPSCG
jgi:hypothetical protein